MRTTRVLALVTLALAVPSVGDVRAARGAPVAALPDFVPAPVGATVKGVDYLNYGETEFTFKEGGGTKHAKVDGHTWTAHLLYDDGKHPDPKIIFPDPLTKAGWTVLDGGGVLVAKRTHDGHDVYLRADNAGMVVVEAVDLPTLALAPPAPDTDEPAEGKDLPYVAPLPRAKLRTWKLEEDRPMEINIAKPAFHAFFSPVTHVVYDVTELSAVEVTNTYVPALEKAGWTIVSGPGAGITSAHYAKNGRDLWLQIGDVENSLHVLVADVGAAAAEKKLAAALDKDGHVAIYGIYFDTDKSTLRPDSEASLQQILKLLKTYPKLVLEIQGHTDNEGDHDHNQKLSDARAASVKSWLVAHGVADARLTTKGYAETKPVADNKTPQGRAKNRRVELAKP